MVARADGAPGRVAVACDCGMEERAVRVMERARIPKRYEHCDFESYVTDLADGKTWTGAHSQSLKQAKMLAQGFVRDYPGSAEKGLLLMGPSGVGEDASGGGGFEGVDSSGSCGTVLRLPRTVEGDSG
jgi:DNA replication protein DnaC